MLQMPKDCEEWTAGKAEMNLFGERNMDERGKQMKVLHTADWHIGTFKGPEKDGVNLRFLDTKKCLESMVEAARRERPELVLVSGDIFHLGKTGSDRCCKEVILAMRVISELAESANHVIVMRGTPNHDGRGPFEVLSEHFADAPDVYIVTEPAVIQTDEADIAVLPGFDAGTYRAKFPGLGKQEENEAISRELGNIVMGLRAQCRPGIPSILMAHYTVPGSNTESGQSQILTQFEPVVPMESLEAADYDLVALGHIHRPQQLETVRNAFYSGSINANNFNDEGQKRGFWIHELISREPGNWDSTFHATPYREFLTYHFTDTDVTALIHGGIDEVAMNYWRWNGAIQGKIVRILYECSEDKKRAFNTALLEQAMYDDGAFYVAGILPEKITDKFANRTELARTTDPEANLIKYLEEKQIDPDQIKELALKARPVVAEAEANAPSAANTGIFEPVEISVRNYRNYVEETFNFENITFCMINGQNGAGKSSLFMDAIIDCLYEEPREGRTNDESGKAYWLRNDEKAASGSITFTFRIGEKTYRVTRTRQRSGRGTLAIAQLVDGEWIDCSKGGYNAAQKEILNILGMDSFTFKSCALIMQDQYGLFLQAKPKERVDVLSSLLGLDIYQAMERIAADKSKANSARYKELKQKIEVHNSTISGFGNPEEKLELYRKELAEYEACLQAKMEERDHKKLQLVNRQGARERYFKISAEIHMLIEKEKSLMQNKSDQQIIIDHSAIILDQRQEIESKAAEYNSLQERERQLAGEAVLYDSKYREVISLAQQADSEQKNIDSFKEKLRRKKTELLQIRHSDQDQVIKEKAAEYEKQKLRLDEAYQQERLYREIELDLMQQRSELQKVEAQKEATIKGLRLNEESLRKKMALLANVECVDLSKAKCSFLADAMRAKQLLEDYSDSYEECRLDYEKQANPIRKRIADLEKRLADVGHNAEVLEGLSRKVAELKTYRERLEEISRREARIPALEADLTHLQLNIQEASKRLSEVKLKGMEAKKERDRYQKAFEGHIAVTDMIKALSPWLEKERQIPVEEERRKTAFSRIAELEEELLHVRSDIENKTAEMVKEAEAMHDEDKLKAAVDKADKEVETYNILVKEKQMKVGALQQIAGQIVELKKEIKELQELQTQHAKESADYDILKAAFGQNGIPHQIIRSIIPRLAATSNTILGQMTGGKMRVEFRLERIQKDGNEKASLDILVEEHGKKALPYLSRSGGEKVKSSLSVILALAEIKSASAGIQLGMLFIDEPPFLDSDGIQAYCDALEAIEAHYPGIKVMAITHDPTMKARFPQSLEVVKTEQGSKVIY